MRRFLRGFALLLTLIPAMAQAQAPPVTAYQAPWNPVGSTASLSVTNATGNVVLGWVGSGQAAPATALVCNTGSKTAYVKLGASTVTAATTDFPLYANIGGPPLCASLALNGAPYIAGITSGADTTSLTISAGTGQAGGNARYGSGGAVGALTVGTTAITGGAANQILYDNAGVVGEVAGANSSVLVTTAGGVLSLATTLPNVNHGTPTALVGTNITGTAAGLTAGTVTTNANLTGPVTSTGNATAIATGAITQTMVAASTLATGTSVSLSAPRQYYVCTGTCTVTPPVPAAGYEFCVWNKTNVATVITLAALGSSASYENTARTAAGTAGTGTFVSGGAVGDKVCIVGVDSTHYETPSFNGTWTAN